MATWSMGNHDAQVDADALDQLLSLQLRVLQTKINSAAAQQRQVGTPLPLAG